LEKVLCKEEEDKWMWKEGESLIYIVKSTYNSLLNMRSGKDRTIDGKFWKIKALPSMQLLA